jgi:enolase-phosphatase E1
MTEPVRAVLTDLEGTAIPMSFMTGTLLSLVRERLGSYIARHADDAEVEDALSEAGRLFGGFTLKLEEAEALFLRWMKQDRKATPLKTIQGLIWQEGYDGGEIKSEIYPDVADSLKAWAADGLRLFVYSSNSERAQKLILSHAPSGDLTSLFEGFFDTTAGQKIEPASYEAICRKLDLPAAAVLVLCDNEEELDTARSVGMATTRIVRGESVKSRHPVCPDLPSVRPGGIDLHRRP